MVLLCGTSLPPSLASMARIHPKRGHHARVPVHGVECDPIGPRAGMGGGVSGRLEMPLLPVVPRAMPQSLPPPKRTCLADPDSSPRTERAPVCKYFLKWKHRDRSWTRFQDGDVSSGHEGQWSGENGAFQTWRVPSHTASAPEMQAAVREGL